MARVRRALKYLLALCLVIAPGFSAASPAALRVISLYPAHSENIVALGAGNLLVAVSAHDSPELLPKLPRMPSKAGAEAFIALRPDLVLTRSLSVRTAPNLYQALQKAGIHVEVIDPPAWEAFPDYLARLAGLLGVNPDDAVTLFKLVSGEIKKEALRRSKGKRKPSVFIESTYRSLRTCAPDSWAASLIALAGGNNAAAEAVPVSSGSAVAVWGLERVLRTVQSGLDVYIVQHGAMNASTGGDVMNRPWALALKNTRVAEVPEAYLSRPSLFGLEKGGKMLIDIFYGE